MNVPYKKLDYLPPFGKLPVSLFYTFFTELESIYPDLQAGQVQVEVASQWVLIYKLPGSIVESQLCSLDQCSDGSKIVLGLKLSVVSINPKNIPSKCPNVSFEGQFCRME